MIAALLALLSCAGSAEAADGSAAALVESMLKAGADSYFLEPADGAVYPAKFPPPAFRWDTPIAYGPPAPQGSSLILRVSEGAKVLHEKRLTRSPWRPTSDLWNSWIGKKLTVDLIGSSDRETHKALPVHLEIDSGALPDDVFLRYFDLTRSEGQNDVNVHLLWLDPAARKRRKLISLNTVKMNKCLGCHSVGTSSDALILLKATYGTHASRRLVSIRAGEDGARSYETSPPLTGVMFPRQSPRADKIACSVIASTGIMYTVGALNRFEFSEPFEQNWIGPVFDVAIFDPESGSLTPLPGASDPDYAELNPVWSPDGESIAFERNRTDGKMGIYVVPYNSGKGGDAKPLVGAGDNGEDNYFPEYSPNGRWIAFTRGDARGGIFARDSSDIYLVPARGGTARRLEFNVDGVMDSWHSWSSDSRWLLYSSKRNGISTRAFVARIFEDGRASAPFELESGLKPGQRVNMPFWIKKGAVDPIPMEKLDDQDEAIIFQFKE